MITAAIYNKANFKGIVYGDLESVAGYLIENTNDTIVRLPNSFTGSHNLHWLDLGVFSVFPKKPKRGEKVFTFAQMVAGEIEITNINLGDMNPQKVVEIIKRQGLDATFDGELFRWREDWNKVAFSYVAQLVFRNMYMK